MKAILLAGGSGKRMRPSSYSTNKQLMPVYNKPMIFYPLSLLMLLKIKDIILVCDTQNIDNYKKLLNNGNIFGIKITYLIQEKPNGIPESFILAKDLIKNNNVCLLLGDNFFFGQQLQKVFNKGVALNKGTFFYTYNVSHPENYAVLELNKKNKIKKITEKPKKFKTNMAIPGIYFFDKNVSEYTEQLKKSKRGELEITNLIEIYIKKKLAKFQDLGRGVTWLDMGTFDDMNDTANFIRAVENRQGFMIGCPEEIAWRNKWISKNKLILIAKKYKNSYGDYLKKICKK